MFSPDRKDGIISQCYESQLLSPLPEEIINEVRVSKDGKNGSETRHFINIFGLLVGINGEEGRWKRREDDETVQLEKRAGRDTLRKGSYTSIYIKSTFPAINYIRREEIL